MRTLPTTTSSRPVCVLSKPYRGSVTRPQAWLMHCTSRSRQRSVRSARAETEPPRSKVITTPGWEHRRLVRHGQHDHMIIGRNEIGVQHMIKIFVQELGIALA